jgi:DNA recombination protein RmuC
MTFECHSNGTALPGREDLTLSIEFPLDIVGLMIWFISIAGGIFFVGAILAFFKFNQTQLQGGFRLLQESFESLQRNLLLHQKEFERTYDQKSGALRNDLAQELQNNRRELQLGLSQTTQALEIKVTAFDTKLDQRMRDLTQGVQTKLEENVKEGFRHFEKVQEHLKLAERQLLNLNVVGQSINELNNLLKMPHLRGNFGEATLERLLSDMLPQDAFELQYRINPESTERVDAVIKYPQSVLPIDSKFPREQVLPLFETNDPQGLELARKHLIDVMKTLGRQIKEKYIRPDLGTTDMALLFVPSETLYFECLRNSRLFDELSRHKVYAVSPNTLAVTLHAISMARNYYEMAKGVEKTITEVKRTRQHLDNFEKKFEEVGSYLGRAQNSFNTAGTHLSRYRSAVTRLTGAEPSGLEEPLTLPTETSN